MGRYRYRFADGAGAPEVLAPTLTNLTGWYETPFSVVGLNDNDPIDTVVDQSSHAATLTAALTARPTFKTGIVFGLPVMRFDGVLNKLTSTALMSSYFGASAKTAIFAFKPTTLTVAGVPAYNGPAIFTSSTRRSSLLIDNTNPTLGQLTSYNSDGSDDFAVLAAAGGLAWQIATYQHNGTNVRVSLNGGAFTDTASGATTVMTDVLSVGGLTLVDSFLDADLYAGFFYNAVLSSGDRRQTEQYLASKVGVTLV